MIRTAFCTDESNRKGNRLTGSGLTGGEVTTGGQEYFTEQDEYAGKTFWIEFRKAGI